jgi:hypothetical protein
MNAAQPGADAYRPYEAVESWLKMAATKPLNQYTYEEAKELAGQIVKTWSAKCRENAGIIKPTPDWWSHETSYIDQCVKKADPKNLVRSIVDCFIQQATDELPF